MPANTVVGVTGASSTMPPEIVVATPVDSRRGDPCGQGSRDGGDRRDRIGYVWPPGAGGHGRAAAFALW